MLKALFTALIVFGTVAAEANTVKVLILDDVFQEIPARGEKIERMGKLQGDLLVNGTRYAGDIEIWRGKSSMYLINEIPLEDYIRSVVASEVGVNWDMEALKAQAVIARTYALYQKSRGNGGNYDLTSSVLHQVYKGSTVDARVAYAVGETEREVLTYEGRIIEALYHSTCGGETEDAEDVFGRKYPYLKPVKSNCELSPYWIWERRIPAEEIGKALNVREVEGVAVSSHTPTGRVKEVTVTGNGGPTTIKATDLRKALGWNRLPSTNFIVTRENGTFVFEGKGYGHGVGLCQWSALEMAREGKNYREILSFFYPGTILQLHEDR